MQRLDALGITVLRTTIGLVFISHGLRKLVIDHFGGVARNLAVLGLPAPDTLAIAATLVEFVCGVLMTLGLFTRWAALLLVIDASAALVFARMAGGYYMPRGFEFDLVLVMCCLVLAIAGPGRAALDAYVRHDRIF